MPQKPPVSAADSSENQSKNSPQEPYYLSHEEFIRVCRELKPAERDVLYYLKTLDSQGNKGLRLSTAEIAKNLKRDKSTVGRALQVLAGKGWVDLVAYGLKPHERQPESVVRDRLSNELGGWVEFMTSVGRIDVLTHTQVIEVKRLCHWKSALGQVLVYSAFFPNHTKRIHLFGTQKEASKVADIESACLLFGVLVTFEVVAE